MTTKTQQLDVQNFYSSVVCSYCSIVCLTIKSGSEMVENSNASYENEIHSANSASKEDSKNIIFWVKEAIMLGERRAENSEKMAKDKKICCYTN